MAIDNPPPQKYYSFDAPEFNEIEKLLIDAAERGDLQDVKKYGEQGVSETALNEAFYWAGSNGHLNVLAYLHEEKKVSLHNDDLLLAASWKGHLPIVQYMREQGADITILNNAALFNAVIGDHLPLVKYYREEGVDMATWDNEAMIHAGNCGHTEIAEYLHEWGGDVTARDNEPLRRAVDNGHYETAAFFIEKGAPIEVLTPEQQNAMKELLVSRNAAYSKIDPPCP